MSVIEPPLVNRSQFSPSDEEMDNLLRTYFQNELPRPWPALQPPAAGVSLAPPVSSRTGLLTPSRLALAASVALLLGGQAWLHHAFQDDDSANLGGNASPGVPLARPDLHGKKTQRPTPSPNSLKDAPPPTRSAKPMR